jgi:hypothetical protein
MKPSAVTRKAITMTGQLIQPPPNRFLTLEIGQVNRGKIRTLISLLQFSRRIRKFSPWTIYANYVMQWEEHRQSQNTSGITSAVSLMNMLHACFCKICKLITIFTTFLINFKLELLYKAPFGDPIAISMNGSILTLRLDEAKFIQVCSSPL